MNGLERINKDIIKKIDNLNKVKESLQEKIQNQDENIKEFLKEALIEEYTNRNDPITVSSTDKKNPNYEGIIEKYCEQGYYDN